MELNPSKKKIKKVMRVIPLPAVPFVQTWWIVHVAVSAPSLK